MGLDHELQQCAGEAEFEDRFMFRRSDETTPSGFRDVLSRRAVNRGDRLGRWNPTKLMHGAAAIVHSIASTRCRRRVCAGW